MKDIIKYRKKEIVVIAIILLFAIFTTRYIYDKFEKVGNVDYNTDTLDITFHEESGAEVNLLKVTPVTDSVGLSSKAYKFTIKNNTNSSVRYSIYINNNKQLVEKDDCGEYQIPNNIIRFAIHKENEKNQIYTLSDLINGRVVSRIIKAKEKEEYTMRFWIVNNNTLPTGVKLHYHGLIDVKDEGVEIATSIN